MILCVNNYFLNLLIFSIVPLMEPDLQRGAHIEFPPRVVALVRSREGEYERDVLQDEEFDVDDVFSTSVL